MRDAERKLRIGADVRQVAGGGPDHRHLLLQEVARRGAPVDDARRVRMIFRGQIDPVAQRLDAGGTGEIGLGAVGRWPACRRPRSPAPGTANTRSRWREFARPNDRPSSPLRLVSFAAKSACSSQVAGGMFGVKAGILETPPCSSTARSSSAETACPRCGRRSRRSSGRLDRSCRATPCPNRCPQRVERHDQIVIDQR